MKEAEQGPERPAAVADRGEDAVVDESEALASGEVQAVAERLSAGSRGGEDRAKQGRLEMELAGLEPATSWVRSRRSPN